MYSERALTLNVQVGWVLDAVCGARIAKDPDQAQTKKPLSETVVPIGREIEDLPSNPERVALFLRERSSSLEILTETLCLNEFRARRPLLVEEALQRGDANLEVFSYSA
ncbi:hypothetical protein CF319_g9505 [Tilletia indica]|nr:hypothetical protein CF319_g9505 [Tilletia indica]